MMTEEGAMQELDYQANRARLAEVMAQFQFSINHLDEANRRGLVAIYGVDGAAVAVAGHFYLDGSKILHVFAGLGSPTTIREKIIPRLDEIAALHDCGSIVVEGAGGWMPEPGEAGYSSFTRAVRKDLRPAIAEAA